MLRHLTQKTELQAATRDLTHAAPQVRIDAARALGEISGPQVSAAAQALRERLRDACPDVRYAVALSLGQLEDREAVADLVQILGEDPESLPRQAAAVALGQIADPRATGALLEALSSPSADLRFQVVGALPHVNAEAAVEPLQRALSDEDAEIRAAAAAALGDLAAQGAREPLAALLADPAERVAAEAAVALARLGDTRAVPLLVEMLRHREYALLAAEHLFGCPAAAAAPALRRVVQRWLAPRLLKVWAAGTLARLDDPLGRDKLLELLQSREQAVRGLAIQVLGSLAQPWSCQALEQLRQSPAADEWQEEIAEALASSDASRPAGREDS